MTHPITPPPELVHEWETEATISREAASSWTTAFATRAAQWGADQELEACCEWLHEELKLTVLTLDVGLRAARRPKPPSLKEQAMEVLKNAPGPDYPSPITLLTADEHALIRRALEALPE